MSLYTQYVLLIEQPLINTHTHTHTQNAHVHVRTCIYTCMYIAGSDNFQNHMIVDFHTSNFCRYSQSLPNTHTHTPVNIERSDNFGKRKILSDGTGHPDLVDTQIGVWSNDSSGREVHSLSHQISSHSALLTLKSLFH